MVKIKDVVSVEIGTERTVQDLVQSNEDVSSKSKLQVSEALQEDVQEDLGD